jgi:hypothetical protein
VDCGRRRAGFILDPGESPNVSMTPSGRVECARKSEDRVIAASIVVCSRPHLPAAAAEDRNRRYV